MTSSENVQLVNISLNHVLPDRRKRRSSQPIETPL